MNNDQQKMDAQQADKKPYVRPELVNHGKVEALTQQAGTDRISLPVP